MYFKSWWAVAASTSSEMGNNFVGIFVSQLLDPVAVGPEHDFGN